MMRGSLTCAKAPLPNAAVADNIANTSRREAPCKHFIAVLQLFVT
jgi:hypothetical protein